MLFDDAVTEFLEEQEYKGNSPRTILYYRERLLRFQTATGAENLSDFNERAIRRWLMSHKAVSRNTLANYDRALRVFANWLFHRGIVSDNPMGKLPKPRETPTQITPFTAKDIRTMLSEAKRRRYPLRDAAMITLLLDTGIRIGEATALCLHDVQWTEGYLRVDGKTGERNVPFGRKAKLALKKYIDRERVASSVNVAEVFLTNNGLPLRSFQATQHLIRIARAGNIQTEKVGPHQFRHTFAVEFIRAGGDAFTLQQILGHTTLEMTR